MAAEKYSLLAPAKGQTDHRAADLRNGGQKAGCRPDPAAIAGDGSGHAADPDSAEYIAVLASQLHRIASTNGHEFLAYLIDMVVVEAWRQAGPDADHPDRSGQPHQVSD